MAQQMDVRKMMKEAQKMQREMEKAQEEIAAMEFSASAGGGVVTATVAGDKTVKSIVIDPEAVDPEDIEMLQDMICAAVNEALRVASVEADTRMNALTGGFSLPGMGGGAPYPGRR